MTLHTPVTAVPINARKFVLATDLDGTFLGGSDADRKTLYDWIEANRDTIGLIFVTGRDPKFIGELCDGGVPWPEYVIGDVGTTIAKVNNRVIDPIIPLEEDIASRWGDAGASVRAALEGHPGLSLQPTEFRYRVSYDLHPDDFDPAAHDIVQQLGYDTLVSDNKYFDVLPRGVSKGPSLKRLVAHLGIDPKTVLAAGDTMNDLSMLQCGLPAVAVGGSEPDLLSRVRDLEQVHKATAIGAAGILEAVSVRNLHATPKGD
ncbi:hypothetical protein P775_28335 [Puniceibacterium antarcticum]|uniref:Sucrose phosphatase-like domain-containing protein n=1 Tax=Puniceibacterium antarcticum TaxID=1206336 RepID=A0A2G8QSZ0_9RHOB|nr:HAD-IIB family hydrolase [Puniceibacterium antarcticum]PIL12415.1 hypothetical protein P775_28335 [Puniceibacterium antarcticum]